MTLLGEARPRDGKVERRAVAGAYVLADEQPPGLQHACESGVEAALVLDVHLHLDGPHHVELRVLERQLQRVADLEAGTVGQPGQARQLVGYHAEFRREIDARHVAIASGSKIPCRAAQAAAHIQNARSSRNLREFRQRTRRGAALGVKLVRRREVLVREGNPGPCPAPSAPQGCAPAGRPDRNGPASPRSTGSWTSILR